MKAIKIKKTFRNGEKIHIIFVSDDSTEDCIKDAVEYWAEAEGSGMNYGYRCEWEEATDREEIKVALEKKFKSVQSQIEGLTKLYVDLENYRFLLNEPG